jgi:hypothetical protein
MYERDGNGCLIQTARRWRPRVEVLDLRPLPPAELAEAVRRAASELAAGRFDLEREPPFRMRMLRIGERRRLLLAATHHIVLDGWSASLFADALASTYREPSRGATTQAVQRQYGEFAAWQRRFLTGSELEPIRDFWRAHFRDGPPPTRLPRDGIGDPSDLAGRRVTRVLEPARAARLGGLAREAGVTLFPLFLRAFARMLGDASGEPEVVFGTTLAGRHTPGSAEMLGVFVNPLPVRMAVGDTGPTLAAASDLLTVLHDHQSYVLADLVRHVEPFVGLDINETFHNYVLFQNFPRPAASDPDLRVEVLETDGSIDDPLLAVLGRETTRLMREHELVIHRLADGGLLLSFWYRQSLFERATVSAWADSYMAALEAPTLTPSTPERLALDTSR